MQTAQEMRHCYCRSAAQVWKAAALEAQESRSSTCELEVRALNRLPVKAGKQEMRMISDTERRLQNMELVCECLSDHF